MPGSNIEVVRAFIREFFNGHDPAAAERFCTADYVFHAGSLGVRNGVRPYAEGVARLTKGLPDLHASEQGYVEAGDLVAIRYVVQGTHRGELWGIAPTGRAVRWEANIFYRIDGGRIAEQWAIEDWAGLFQQIGVFDPPFPK